MRSKNNIVTIVFIVVVFVLSLVGITKFVVQLKPSVSRNVIKSNLAITDKEELVDKSSSTTKKISEERSIKIRGEEIYPPQQINIEETSFSDMANNELDFTESTMIISESSVDANLTGLTPGPLEKSGSTMLPPFTPVFTNPPPAPKTTDIDNASLPSLPAFAGNKTTDSGGPILTFPPSTYSAPPYKENTATPLSFPSDRNSKGPPVSK